MANGETHASVETVSRYAMCVGAEECDQSVVEVPAAWRTMRTYQGSNHYEDDEPKRSATCTALRHPGSFLGGGLL